MAGSKTEIGAKLLNKDVENVVSEETMIDSLSVPRKTLSGADFDKLIQILRKSSIESGGWWGVWLRKRERKKEQGFNQVLHEQI